MIRPNRPWFVVAILILVVLAAGACGSSGESASTELTTSETPFDCVVPSNLVPASEVEVLGDLDSEQREIVTWALGRFSLIDLELTTPIRVQFDSSRELCHGDPGRCLLYTTAPAELFVCEPEGQTAARIADRRLTVLHELAHVWHFAQGDGVNWPDRSAIVGGVAGDDDVAWIDQTVERVADVVSWGLMDFEQRRARGDIPCQDMYAQFVRLTGHAPLPPINQACIPGLGG